MTKDDWESSPHLVVKGMIKQWKMTYVMVTQQIDEGALQMNHDGILVTEDDMTHEK
jgi:hypothetical protein